MADEVDEHGTEVVDDEDAKVLQGSVVESSCKSERPLMVVTCPRASDVLR